MELEFPKGYIAHPYWPEREKVINIQKESGTKRARSEEKRIKNLRDYLVQRGLSMEDYEELVRKADRQFYTVADLNGAVLPDHRCPTTTGRARWRSTVRGNPDRLARAAMTCRW